eukprot:s3986_g2.t2
MNVVHYALWESDCGRILHELLQSQHFKDFWGLPDRQAPRRGQTKLLDLWLELRHAWVDSVDGEEKLAAASGVHELFRSERSREVQQQYLDLYKQLDNFIKFLSMVAHYKTLATVAGDAAMYHLRSTLHHLLQEIEISVASTLALVFGARKGYESAVVWPHLYLAWLGYALILPDAGYPFLLSLHVLPSCAPINHTSTSDAWGPSGTFFVAAMPGIPLFHRIESDTLFALTCDLVVFCNLVYIGVEVDFGSNESLAEPFFWCRVGFLIWCGLEFAIRILGGGADFFNLRNLCEMVFVGCAALDVILFQKPGWLWRFSGLRSWRMLRVYQFARTSTRLKDHG